VAELFAPFGEVANCSLPLERDTGRKRGFAFVEMADDDSENRAIEALQGAELMGRPLRINKAEPRTGGGGGGGGGPRRSGGYSGGGGYGGGGSGYGAGGGYAGAAGSGSASPERGSGARGWEDRSYGGGDSFGEGRSRRRRSSGGGSGGGDAYGGYSGAED